MKILEANKEVYSRNHVIASISAYQNLCSVDFSESERYWILTFKDCVYGEQLTVKEFENYLIGLENGILAYN